MIGVYFSGTGNTKYCVERFVRECDKDALILSIEENDAVGQLEKHQVIVIGYPVQFSSLPKMFSDFIIDHRQIWNGKKIFLIATMGLFSGDGAGVAARLLQRYGAEPIGGLHLKMPDSVCDVKALKRSPEKNRKLVAQAEVKVKNAAIRFKNGRPPQEGLGILDHAAGLFGQRLYFYGKTKRYSDRLKIDMAKCTGCGRCATLCPMKNIRLHQGKAVPQGQCTMCYRCVNRCPAQAITLLGKKVVVQGLLESNL